MAPAKEARYNEGDTPAPSIRMTTTDALRETARLDALASFEVLDTPREQDFDDVAALASAICETPISVVNLIGDGRQFFKAEVGLGVRETPLESSFCARAILEQDFLLVPDATKDARFDCNPLVTGEPHLRFYAGALLKTEEGLPIGTVCVLDYRPRDLSELQQQTLRVLARQVMKQLELRRALKARVASERRLDLLARASLALLSASEPLAAVWPILERGARAVGFEQAYAYDVVEGDRCLALTHSIGTDDALRTALRRASFDEPLCGIVAEQGQALVLENIQAGIEPRYEIARRNGLNAYAGFPLLHRKRPFGVISFASKAKPAFEDEALSFFAAIAHIVSMARQRLAREAEDFVA